MSSSVHIDNKGKDILILGEGPTQRKDCITLTAKAIYAINFTQLNKRFGLMEATTFFNDTKINFFKSVDSEIKDYALFVCNISKLIT